MSVHPTTPLKLKILDTALPPAPFKPEQIIDGNPQPTQLIVWRPDDDSIRRAGLWECDEGKSWYRQEPEEISAFVFLSGDATVTPEGGEPMRCGAGDMIFLPEGTMTIWDVHETIRTFFWVHI